MTDELITPAESVFFTIMFIIIVYLLGVTFAKQVGLIKISHNGLQRLRILQASFTGALLAACSAILFFNICNLQKCSLASQSLNELPYITTFAFLLVALILWLEYRLFGGRP